MCKLSVSCVMPLMLKSGMKREASFVSWTSTKSAKSSKRSDIEITSCLPCSSLYDCQLVVYNVMDELLT